MMAERADLPMLSNEKARLLNPLDWAEIGLTSADLDAVGTCIAPRLDALGIENAGLAIDIPRSVPAVPAQEEMLGSLVSPAWHEYYRACPDLVPHDPMARHLFSTETPAFTLPGCPPSVAIATPKEAALLRRVRDFGMRGTLAFSCFERRRGTVSAFVGVTFFDNREFAHTVQACTRQLQMACEYLIEGMRLRAGNAHGIGRPLSVRERECLLWASIGKTTKEIADKLALTDHTVNSYIASAMRKLGATTRAQACMRAILLDQIAP